MVVDEVWSSVCVCVLREPQPRLGADTVAVEVTLEEGGRGKEREGQRGGGEGQVGGG